MAKTFYTERDIEDLVRRGIRTLQVNDDVVLTELAYESAARLELKLLKGGEWEEKPPSAPQRPYLSQQSPKKKAATPAPTAAAASIPAVSSGAVTSTVSPGVTSAPTAASSMAAKSPVLSPSKNSADLAQRIRDAVSARLGGQVDATLVDAIIKRVLTNVGMK